MARDRTAAEPMPTLEADSWDHDWAAERAADALRWLGRNYPEACAASEALRPHEEAAHRAAVRGDRDAYLEALRAYMRAGWDAALEIRRRAA